MRIHVFFIFLRKQKEKGAMQESERMRNEE